MLNRCMGNLESIIPIKGLGVKVNFSYKQFLVEILDLQEIKLRNKEVDF